MRGEQLVTGFHHWVCLSLYARLPVCLRYMPVLSYVLSLSLWQQSTLVEQPHGRAVRQKVPSSFSHEIEVAQHPSR